MTIDLTRRQASRVIAQAIRSEPRLEIEAARSETNECWNGRLVAQSDGTLAIEFRDVAADDGCLLVGSYLDVRMHLDDDLYLFTTCVLDHDANDGAGRVVISTPEGIQIANRRRFERTEASKDSTVRLWLDRKEPAYVGTLRSLSANGMAINVHGLVIDDHALVGDSAHVRFELSGVDAPFELGAVICGKEIDRELQQVRIGVEFEGNDQTAGSEHARLRATLAELLIDLPDTRG